MQAQSAGVAHGVEPSRGDYTPLRDQAQVDLLDFHADVNLDWGMEEPVRADLLALFMATDVYLAPDFHLDGRPAERMRLMACANASQAWFSLQSFIHHASEMGAEVMPGFTGARTDFSTAENMEEVVRWIVQLKEECYEDGRTRTPLIEECSIGDSIEIDGSVVQRPRFFFCPLAETAEYLHCK